MKNSIALRVFGIAMIALLLLGCEKRRNTESPTLMQEADNEYVICLTIDLSGSFLNQMADSGKAYDFAMRLIEKYYRNRTATNDKIVLCQISGGTDKCLLWEGTIRDLKREFSTANAFRDFLLKHANPNASFVHDGLANVVDYLADDPRVNSGEAKLGLFVLSDMLDNSPDPQKSEERLLESFQKLGGSSKNAVCLYYVNQQLVGRWRQQIHKCGIKTSRVESEIVGKPTLPDFD